MNSFTWWSFDRCCRRSSSWMELWRCFATYLDECLLLRWMWSEETSLCLQPAETRRGSGRLSSSFAGLCARRILAFPVGPVASFAERVAHWAAARGFILLRSSWSSHLVLWNLRYAVSRSCEPPDVGRFWTIDSFVSVAGLLLLKLLGRGFGVQC